MTMMIEHSRWMAALGTALVQFLWQAALVGGALAAARPLLRRASARARYAWDCAALLALPVIFAATLMAAHAAGADGTDLLLWLPAAVGTWLQRSLTDFLPYIVAAWAAGVVALAAYSLGGWWLVQRVRRAASREIPAAWTLRFEQLRQRAGGLRRQGSRIALGLSSAVHGPCVVGWWRPLILLPLSAVGAIAPEALEALLAHELAHIRRRDYLVNLLQRGVEVLFFYHPAVWWISRQVAEEREHCCDDAAIAACGDRLAYARALVDLAGEGPTRARRPQIALAASGGSLRGRVARIVGRSTASGAWGFAAAMAALALFGLGLAAGPARPAAAQPRVWTGAVSAELVSYHVPLVAPVAAADKIKARASFAVRRPGPRVPARPLPARASVAVADNATVPELAPPAPRAVVVGFTFAAVNACASRLQWVQHLSPAGYMWIDVEPVMHCAPALQPVGVWVLTAT